MEAVRFLLFNILPWSIHFAALPECKFAGCFFWKTDRGDIWPYFPRQRKGCLQRIPKHQFYWQRTETYWRKSFFTKKRANNAHESYCQQIKPISDKTCYFLRYPAREKILFLRSRKHVQTNKTFMTSEKIFVIDLNHVYCNWTVCSSWHFAFERRWGELNSAKVYPSSMLFSSSGFLALTKKYC